jgi:hypothetical protein
MASIGPLQSQPCDVVRCYRCLDGHGMIQLRHSQLELRESNGTASLGLGDDPKNSVLARKLTLPSQQPPSSLSNLGPKSGFLIQYDGRLGRICSESISNTGPPSFQPISHPTQSV